MTGRPLAADTGLPPAKGLFRSRLRDARIRSKLGLILIIPLIAVVALAAVRLVDTGSRALSTELVRSLAAVSVETTELAHLLHHERMAAARLLIDPEGDGGGYNNRTARTDQAIEGYQAARAELGGLPDIVADRLERVDEQLAELPAVRQQIVGDGPVTVSSAVLRYSVILVDLISYQESVGQVAADPELAEEIRAAAALSKAKTHMGDSAALSLVPLGGGDTPDEGELSRLVATLTGQQEAMQTFSTAASPAQLAAVSALFTGGPVEYLDIAASNLGLAGEGQFDPARAANAFDALVDLLRRAEQELQDNLLASVTDLRDGVYQQALIEMVAVLLALIITIAVAVLLARMLARSLGQLRANALTVAEKELPETVARLSDPRTLGENTPEQLAAGVREPIQLRSRDEIGQVAQAFNVVHRAAVRVAAEQAALRTSVSAMFLNLARRSQSLVDRMISQLDEIERHEEDPKRLARMFVLDHLATRMRRNDENLLVLAGADSSPPRSDDALVTDALRAAQSEVEHYARIEFGTVDSDVSVIAGAVNDVVRLVAELFDNATRFSPPDAAVVCEARRLGDHVIIQIEDRGVGMSQDQVNRLNAWLASPPTLEVTTFRKMGLAVVARLAARHQIRVELRCDPNYGTIAYVALPRAILVLPRSRMRSLEIPAPRSPVPVEQSPAPPPVPARHLGQMPRRSSDLADHPPNWRNAQALPASEHPAAANGQPAATPAAAPPAAADHHNDQHRFDLPVAGRPLYEMTSPYGTTTPHGSEQPPAPPPAPTVAQPPHPEATVELPIFREMEQVWFRSHGDLELHRRGEQRPTQRPAGEPTTAAPRPVAPAASSPPAYQPSSTYQEPTESWRTAADSGWRAAAAAAQPNAGGATRSGLPKRVPQAQLVPGSVETPAASTSRRSPEEIRGLLSAYHRGVQRGRESGAR